MSRAVLVTGGAGFVGANVAVALRERLDGTRVLALDNLSRRGSELNLPRLRAAGVEVVHGDVREQSDLLALGPIDALVECSAEPSALAGVGGSPDYLVKTNLLGAYHCLELARRDGAQVIFLSTSRVYPVRHLLGLALEETETRYQLAAEQPLPGASARGIAETFPLDGARTLYGATKLAAEHLVTEYGAVYGLNTVIDRFGVIAGPWQMGRVDQGVFTYWMLAHVLGRPLRYLGFGGKGKQVRDLLHVDDAVDLIVDQLEHASAWVGQTVNAGGGREVSLSLREATALCAEISGTTVAVEEDGTDRPGDVPVYLTDTTKLQTLTGWRPRRDARQVLSDAHDWIRAHRELVQSALP